MTAPGEIYTFWLKRVPGTETFEGAVVDDYGWRFNLVGKLSADKKEVTGTGTLVDCSKPMEIT